MDSLGGTGYSYHLSLCIVCTVVGGAAIGGGVGVRKSLVECLAMDMTSVSAVILRWDSYFAFFNGFVGTASRYVHP